MRIIIIRPGAIGDTLLTLPAIEKLRKHYEGLEIHSGNDAITSPPERVASSSRIWEMKKAAQPECNEDPLHPVYPQRPHITFVGNAAVLPLLLASGLVDETYNYDETRWSALFSPGGIRNPALRDMFRQADRVICLLRDPDGIVQRNLSAAGVHRSTVGPGRPPEGKGYHAASYLASIMGVRFYEDERFTLQLDFPAKQPGDRYTVAIHPGSGGAQKCWPPASFAEVITALWRRGTAITLFSGPADAQRLQEVLHHLPVDSKEKIQRSLTIFDNIPLLEVARHLLLCSRYLGNDSGITHLAAMLGLPTIALFGPSYYLSPREGAAIWHPIGRYVEVIHDPDMAHISVHSVIEKVL